MTLYKHILDDIRKLSYIERVEFKYGKVYMFYESDGKTKYKTLPYRANQPQLIASLKFIREDSDYFIKEAEKHVRGDYNIKTKNMVVSSSEN